MPYSSAHPVVSATHPLPLTHCMLVMLCIRQPSTPILLTHPPHPIVLSAYWPEINLSSTTPCNAVCKSEVERTAGDSLRLVTAAAAGGAPFLPAPPRSCANGRRAWRSSRLSVWSAHTVCAVELGARHVGPTVRRSAAGSGHWLHSCGRALRDEGMHTTCSAAEPPHPTGCGGTASAGVCGDGGDSAAGQQATKAEQHRESTAALQSKL